MDFAASKYDLGDMLLARRAEAGPGSEHDPYKTSSRDSLGWSSWRPSPRQQRRDRALVSVVFQHGLCREDACSLTVSSIHPSRGVPHLRARRAFALVADVEPVTNAIVITYGARALRNPSAADSWTPRLAFHIFCTLPCNPIKDFVRDVRIIQQGNTRSPPSLRPQCCLEASRSV